MTATKNVIEDWRIWLIGALWFLTTTMATLGYADFSRRMSELEEKGAPVIRERIAVLESRLDNFQKTLDNVESNQLIMINEIRNMNEELILHTGRTKR